MPIGIEGTPKHFFLQRHLLRARNPPVHNGVVDIWDWDCGLAEGSEALAEKIRQHHFPHFRPALVLHSAVPRAKETAELMWGGMPIQQDGRLGPSFIEAMPGGDWRATSNIPATASGEEIWRADPELVEKAGTKAMEAIQEIIATIPCGMAAWGVSHVPIVDMVYTQATQLLTGVPLWLPNQVASGGVVYLRFDEYNILVGVEYYPPPT